MRLQHYYRNLTGDKVERPSPFTEAMVAVAIVAAGLALVVAVFISRASTTPHPSPKASRIISFEEQWRMAELVPLPAAPALPTVASDARAVKLERLVMPTITDTQVVAEQAAPEVTVKPRRVKVYRRDVCRGKGRIVTKNGKSWRCKR